jgi:hypothetical protein
MQPPTNEELGLDERGFPPTDESRDVDRNQIEWNLRLTPAERLRRMNAIREFTEAARLDRIRRYEFDPADPGPTEQVGFPLCPHSVDPPLAPAAHR